MTRLGIDLGGTKIEIVALDDSGCERLRRRVATPLGDYAGTLDANWEAKVDLTSGSVPNCTGSSSRTHSGWAAVH